MALVILTENADGDGWIDNVPGDVATGYQAQNTNITARYLGLDSTTIENINGGDAITIKNNSGVIDVNGVPFTNTSDVTFNNSSFSDNVVSFIKVVDTLDPLIKSFEVIGINPLWNSAKNYYETAAGERVLNWSVTRKGSKLTLRRIVNQMDTVINPSTHAGIGKGGRAKFGEPGVYKLPVTAAGVYEVFAIAGGGAGFFQGGGCARVVLRLEVGNLLDIVVGNYNTDSTINIGGGRLSLLASREQNLSTISVSGGGYQESGTWNGGLGVRNEAQTFALGGGGAGPFSDGCNSYMDEDKSIYILGASVIGFFGNGGVPTPNVIGKGYAEVNWLSE